MLGLPIDAWRWVLGTTHGASHVSVTRPSSWEWNPRPEGNGPRVTPLWAAQPPPKAPGPSTGLPRFVRSPTVLDLEVSPLSTVPFSLSWLPIPMLLGTPAGYPRLKPNRRMPLAWLKGYAFMFILRAQCTLFKGQSYTQNEARAPSTPTTELVTTCLT
jgi:hypothetical protein